MILKYTNKMQKAELLKMAKEEGYSVVERNGVLFIDEEVDEDLANILYYEGYGKKDVTS
jgi:hypothetical protein